MTPSDVYYNRHHKILSRRELIKEKTLKLRKQENQKIRKKEQRLQKNKELVLTETMT